MKHFALQIWNSINKRVLIMVTLLVGIWIIFHILSGGYILRPENLANLFRQVTVVAVLAIGMTLVIVSGNIDLSVGSALGMFGALTAMLVTTFAWNSLLSVVLILILGVCAGCLHGALIHFARIPAFVVTLGGLIAYRGVLQYVARQSIPIRHHWIKAIAQNNLPHWLTVGLLILVVLFCSAGVVRKRAGFKRAELPLEPVWLDIFHLGTLLCVVGVLAFVFLAGEGTPISFVLLLFLAATVGFASRHTRFGRYVYAVGGNRQAAHYSGISLAKTTIGVFAIMGFLSAVAGIISISELSSAAPDIGDLKELESIAACVIGGTSLMGGSGSIGMSVLGALIMASIRNGMSMMGMDAQMQKVILGTVLVVAVGLDQWSRREKNG